MVESAPSTDTALFVLVCLLCIAVAVLVLWAILRWRRSRAREYLPKALLTGNEKEFFRRLQQAVPEYTLLTQVAMGALMNGRHASGNHLRTRAKFAQKIVDYVLLDDRLDVVLLVELDDKTHEKKKDKARDAMTDEAGYRTLRVESRAKPPVAELRSLVLKAIRKAPKRSDD